MPALRTLDPTESRTATFGAELRRRRLEAELTQGQLGARAGYSASQVGSVEMGTRRPTEQFISGCEAALGGGLQELWAELSPKDTAPKWFEPWITTEERALAITTWEPLVVPGLLQTPEYARALLHGEQYHSPNQIESLVAGRLARQSVLARTNPPRYLAVLDEGVLSRPVGSSEVMREQLERLLEVACVPHVTLQVVPLGANPGLSGGIVLASLPGGSRQTAYLETAGEPVVTSAPEVVSAVNMKLDTIRAGALPQGATREVVRKMVETWT